MHELAARLPWIIAGLGMLVLAGFLVGLRTRHLPTRVFALFLTVRAVSLPDVQFILHDTATALRWAQLDAVAEISIAFVAVVFGLLYPRPRRLVKQSSWALVPIPVALGALLALFLADPSLFATYQTAPNGTLDEATLGPLSLFWDIQVVVYAALGFVFARDAFAEPAGPMRNGLIFVAVGFSVLSLYHGPSVGLGLARVALGLDDAPSRYLLWARTLASLSAVFGVMTIAVMARNLPGARPAERRALITAFAAYGAAFVIGAIVGGFQLWSVYMWRTMSVDDLAQGILRWALPLVVAYALVRHRVFAIELGLKWTLRQGTLVVAALAAVLLAREAAVFVNLDTLATVFGLLSAAVIAVALLRIHRVAERFADAAMPAVDGSETYLDKRGLEVYHTALEDALGAHGTLSPQSVTSLARLRSRLGIAERDHEVLLLTIGATGGDDGRGVSPIPGKPFLGRYHVERVLGVGGQGTAFLAHDTEVDRAVAIKAVSSDLTAEDVLDEARAMGAVQHPNVATIYGVERVGNQVFVVMEYLAGGSLVDRVKSGPLDPEDLARVGGELLEGLAAIHKCGVVHRDVKPSNVLMTADGICKIADFGIAGADPKEATVAATAGTSGLGTVQYMAPEHARGRAVTAACDLFSAAATLYEAYMGTPYLAPYPGETWVELRMRAAAAGPFNAEFEGPPALEAWFARALAPHAGDRFSDAREMGEALAKAVEQGSETR